MRVQLRVHAATGVLAEQRRDETLGVDLVHPVGAAPGDGTVALEPAQGGGHRCVVRGEDLGPHEGVGGQGPQDRHRLWGREGRVETPRRLVAEAAAERLTGVGMSALQHPPQLVALDLTAEPDCMTTVSPPSSRRLVRVEVVVDRAPTKTVPGALILGQARVVVDDVRDARSSRIQRRYPEHEGHPGGANALVCSRWGSMRP